MRTDDGTAVAARPALARSRRACARLDRRIEAGLRRSRSTGGPTLVSVTAPVAGRDRPDRDRGRITAAGRGLVLPGAARPGRVGARGARLCPRARSHRRGPVSADRAPLARDHRRRAHGPPATARRGRARWRVGGFAFAPDGGARGDWTASRPLRCSSRRSRSPAGATAPRDVQPRARPDDTPEDLRTRVDRRLRELAERELPLLDPAPVGGYPSTARCRRPTTRRPWLPRSSGSEAPSSRRSCWRGKWMCTHRSTTTRPRCWGCCVRSSAPATCSRWGGARRRSSPPAPSCSSGGRTAGEHGRAGGFDRPERRPGGRRSSGRAAAAQREGSARRTRSWLAGSRAHCDRCRCGSPPLPSRRWCESRTSSTWRPRSGAARLPGRGDRARWSAPPDAGGRRRAARRRDAADSGAGGTRPRVVRRARGLD